MEESERVEGNTGRNADSRRGKDKSVWQRRGGKKKRKKSFSFVSEHHCQSNKDVALTVHWRISHSHTDTHTQHKLVQCLSLSFSGDESPGVKESSCSHLSALPLLTFVMFSPSLSPESPNPMAWHQFFFSFFGIFHYLVLSSLSRCLLLERTSVTTVRLWKINTRLEAACGGGVGPFKQASNLNPARTQTSGVSIFV